MKNELFKHVFRVLLLVCTAGLIFISYERADGQTSKALTQENTEITIMVTAKPHNDRTRSIADRLQPTDFAVSENGDPQEIVSVGKASGEPLTIAVLIQDDLVGRVNNELEGIRDFIKNLPKGSRVMTAYLTAGTIQVAQEFTDDRIAAAKSLRILRSSAIATPYNPYSEVIEALRLFREERAERRVILLVSDGLDVSRGFRSASPAMSVDLDRAIAEAQRRSVSVFTFYAPSVGLTSFSRLAVNFGQGSLNRIADETGGEAFFSGTQICVLCPLLPGIQ